MITALKAIYSLVPAWLLWLLLAASVAANGVTSVKLWDSRGDTKAVQAKLDRLEKQNAEDLAVRQKAVAEAYASYRNTERREAARVLEIEANARTAQNTAKRNLDAADRKLASLLALIGKLTAPAPAGDPVGPEPAVRAPDPDGSSGPIAALGDGYGACLKEYRDMGARSEDRRIKLKAALEWIDLVQERARAGTLVLPQSPQPGGAKTEQGGAQPGAPG